MLNDTCYIPAGLWPDFSLVHTADSFNSGAMLKSNTP
jgi:hypothetical protein